MDWKHIYFYRFNEFIKLMAPFNLKTKISLTVVCECDTHVYELHKFIDCIAF